MPQVQYVLGGFYTVRGYPQSLVAADDGLLFSAEYRYHLPRAFLPESPPRELPVLGEFRVAPQHVYGRPDWDLVLRTFFDWGRVDYSSAVVGESAETLSSLGVGIELAFKNFMSLRIDHGIARSAVLDVDSGDSETHVIATIRY